jgi:diphthine synthase
VALHLVGLGLHDAKDVTVKGLERIRSCDTVYAEFYTAILAGTSHAELEAFLQREVVVLDRAGVGAGAKRLVEEAKKREVALLTAGDPLTATTHTDLMVRAHAAGVALHVVHAPSIYSAAPGLVGLQHYKFGRTTTLVRPRPGWNPESPFDALAENHARDLHTLVLLDIDVEHRYFMTANEGIAQLLDLARRTKNGWFSEATELAVVARAGAREPRVVTGAAAVLASSDFGPPLHCIIVPGRFQAVEAEAWALHNLRA